MTLWEALAFFALGLAVAAGPARWLPERFPAQGLTLATGAVAGFTGGAITRVVLGPDHVLITLLAAVAVGGALLSLLLRPAGRPRRSPRTSGPRPA